MGQIMGTEDLVGDQDLLDEPTDKKARIKQKASSEKRTADTLLSDMTGWPGLFMQACSLLIA